MENSATPLTVVTSTMVVGVVDDVVLAVVAAVVDIGESPFFLATSYPMSVIMSSSRLELLVRVVVLPPFPIFPRVVVVVEPSLSMVVEGVLLAVDPVPVAVVVVVVLGLLTAGGLYTSPAWYKAEGPIGLK
jgi:hypothetical protein